MSQAPQHLQTVLGYLKATVTMHKKVKALGQYHVSMTVEFPIEGVMDKVVICRSHPKAPPIISNEELLEAIIWRVKTSTIQKMKDKLFDI
jgi:hypothetical protein